MRKTPLPSDMRKTPLRPRVLRGTGNLALSAAVATFMAACAPLEKAEVLHESPLAAQKSSIRPGSFTSIRKQAERYEKLGELLNEVHWALEQKSIRTAALTEEKIVEIEKREFCRIKMESSARGQNSIYDNPAVMESNDFQNNLEELSEIQEKSPEDFELIMHRFRNSQYRLGMLQKEMGSANERIRYLQSLLEKRKISKNRFNAMAETEIERLEKIEQILEFTHRKNVER